MKSGKLIELLKEIDPSGEGFIMDSDGGVPKYFEEKPGYYDGAYRYIDAKGRLVYSIENNKVDIMSQDVESAVWDALERASSKKKREAALRGEVYVIGEEESKDTARQQFVFHEGVPDEFRSDIIEMVDKESEQWYAFTLDSDRKWLKDAFDNSEKGVRFFQSKEKDGHGWCPWSTSTEAYNGMCCGLIDAVRESGMFERVSHDDKWWEWRKRQ